MEEKAVMTKREWLASMNDRELAEFIYNKVDEDCDYCIWGKNVDLLDDCGHNMNECKSGIALWLQSEHKE
jgi:hypothetical protein